MSGKEFFAAVWDFVWWMYKYIMYTKLHKSDWIGCEVHTVVSETN